MKSFPFEGQTKRHTLASKCDLGLPQTLEWLDSRPLDPAQYHCKLLCRLGKIPAAEQRKSPQSAGVWNYSWMVKEGRHVQRQEHSQASVHIHMVLHTHIINSLVPQLCRWLWQAQSLINDQWWTVRLRNEKAHHNSTPRSLWGSEGNTGSNVTSKTVQRSSAFWVFFLSAT